MYRTVVVPLDGSALAEQVLPVATTLAGALGATVHLVHVRADRPRYGWDAAADSLAPEELPAPVAICREADRADAALIAMASRGHPGRPRPALDSVADGVLRRASAPVLLWCAADGTPAMQAGELFHHVLVTLDGSEIAEATLPHAELLGALGGARYTLLRVVPHVLGDGAGAAGPFLAATAARGAGSAVLDREATGVAVSRAEMYLATAAARLRARRPGARVDTRVEVDERPGEAIARTAERLGADLVAMTTHACGVSPLMLGRTTEVVLRERSGATLLVRPPLP